MESDPEEETEDEEREGDAGEEEGDQGETLFALNRGLSQRDDEAKNCGVLTLE